MSFVFPCLKMSLFRFICGAVSMDMQFQGDSGSYSAGPGVPQPAVLGGSGGAWSCPPFLSWKSRALFLWLLSVFFLTLIFGRFPEVLSSLSCVDFVEVLECMSCQVLAVFSSSFSAP